MDDKKSNSLRHLERYRELPSELSKRRAQMMEILEAQLSTTGLPSSPHPLSDGIDPPSEFPVDRAEQNPPFLTCEKCGKKHKMYIEEMATGNLDPCSVCSDCMFGQPKFLNRDIIINIGTGENGC